MKLRLLVERKKEFGKCKILADYRVGSIFFVVRRLADKPNSPLAPFEPKLVKHWIKKFLCSLFVSRGRLCYLNIISHRSREAMELFFVAPRVFNHDFNSPSCN